MKMTKGHEPTSKAGGMKAHLGSSPGNNPEVSRKCDTSFGGNAKKHLGQKTGMDGRHYKAPSYPEGAGMKMDADGDYDGSK